MEPSQPGWLGIALSAVGGALALELFFGLVKSKWPSSYYSAGDVVDERISGRWYRFPLYRFVPVYAVSTVAAATVRNTGSAVLGTMISVAALHIAFTSGKAIVLDAVHQKINRRLLTVQLAIIVGIVLIVGLAYLTFDFWRQYLPGFDKYVEVLSTGIVAALATMYLLQWTSGRSGAYDYGEDLLGKIDRSTIDLVVRLAAEHYVDRDLALAILAAENMQRPRYFRRLERALGLVGLAKTHGIMQSSRRWNATDEQSIREAMRSLSNSPLPRELGYTARQVDVLYAIERHNASSEFMSSAEAAFQNLSANCAPASFAVGVDGSPAVRVISSRRKGRTWTILGDVADDVASLQAEVFTRPSAYSADTSPGFATVVPLEVRPGRYRRVWVADFDISYDGLVVTGLDAVYQSHQPRDEHAAHTIEVIPSVF
jgi:hypothetical protein